jgi:putative heme-binding domain-containing protein
VAISLHGGKQIEQLWAELAIQHDGKDRWYLEALGIGASGQEDACYAAWTKRGGNPHSPAGREIVWRLRSAQCAQPLAAIMEDPSTPESEKPRFMRAFDFLPKSEEKQSALIQVATGSKAPVALARHALFQLQNTDAADSPKIRSTVERMMDQSAGSIEFVKLASAFGLGNRSVQLFEMLGKISGTEEAEVALKLLEKSPEGAALLKNAFSGPQAVSLVEMLASTPSASGSPGKTRLAQLMKSGSQEVRVAAVRALARTQAGAEKLIELSRSKQLPEDLRPTAQQALALVQFNDRDNKLRKQIEENFPAPAGSSSGGFPSIAELLKKKGDSERGRAVFARLESSCTTCHKIGASGADFGPNLSEVGTKLGRDALYDAILNPNNGISMGFETYAFKTSNGASNVGILRSETDEEITVALPGGGLQRLNKRDVKGREKLPHSMMPTGLGQILGEQNLVDLVEYLSTCKAK